MSWRESEKIVRQMPPRSAWFKEHSKSVVDLDSLFEFIKESTKRATLKGEHKANLVGLGLDVSFVKDSTIGWHDAPYTVPYREVDKIDKLVGRVWYMVDKDNCYCDYTSLDTAFHTGTGGGGAYGGKWTGDESVKYALNRSKAKVPFGFYCASYHCTLALVDYPELYSYITELTVLADLGEYNTQIKLQKWWEDESVATGLKANHDLFKELQKENKIVNHRWN